MRVVAFGQNNGAYARARFRRHENDPNVFSSLLIFGRMSVYFEMVNILIGAVFVKSLFEDFFR